MAASFLDQSEAPSQQVDSPVDMASAPEAPERPSVPVPAERLAERVEEKRRPAAAQPTVGTCVCVPWDIGVGGSNIDWIQQQPGGPPRDLLYYSSDSDKHQGSGVPSRFSGSKDASANAGLLCISGLQAEDEVDSYCNTGHGSSYMDNVLQNLGELRLKPPQCSLSACRRYPCPAWYQGYSR
ncbi:PREDICTED: immunoglobulin omega chain-like [Odobenus rosmarus divergens]